MSPGWCKPSSEAMRNNVNWTLGNKFQWHFSRNTSFSFKKMRLNMSSAKKIAANMSRLHCVNSLITISTTTKFGKRSDELILMIGELISFSHTRWRHSCQRLCSLRYPLGFQWSPSTWVFLDHYGHMPSYYQKAIDPNVRLNQSYNRISYNISPGQFHIPGNMWRVILGFEVGRVLVWYWRLELLLSLHYSIV